MNQPEQKKVHPLIVRLIAMREAFAPELTEHELRQAAEIAEANPTLDDHELNAIISKEFGLQERYNSRATHENRVVELSNELKALVEKWQILPMLEPRVVAGLILENLNLNSALIGAHIETLKEKAGKRGKGKARKN